MGIMQLRKQENVENNRRPTAATNPTKHNAGMHASNSTEPLDPSATVTISTAQMMHSL